MNHLSVSRRKLLLTLSTGFSAVAAAGCIGTGQENRYAVDQARILNRTSAEHVVRLKIETGDNIAYEEQFTIEAMSGDAPTGVVLDESLPSSQEPYLIRAKLNENEWATVAQSSTVQKDCVKIVSLIENRSGSTSLNHFLSGC